MLYTPQIKIFAYSVEINPIHFIVMTIYGALNIRFSISSKEKWNLSILQKMVLECKMEINYPRPLK